MFLSKHIVNGNIKNIKKVTESYKKQEVIWADDSLGQTSQKFYWKVVFIVYAYHEGVLFVLCIISKWMNFALGQW